MLFDPIFFVIPIALILVMGIPICVQDIARYSKDRETTGVFIVTATLVIGLVAFTISLLAVFGAFGVPHVAN